MTIYDIPKPINLPIDQIIPGDLVIEQGLMFRVSSIRQIRERPVVRSETYPVNWWDENVREREIATRFFSNYIASGRPTDRAAILRGFRPDYNDSEKLI